MEPQIAAVKAWTVNPVTFNGKKLGMRSWSSRLCRSASVVGYLTGAFHFKSKPSAVGCFG